MSSNLAHTLEECDLILAHVSGADHLAIRLFERGEMVTHRFRQIPRQRDPLAGRAESRLVAWNLTAPRAESVG